MSRQATQTKLERVRQPETVGEAKAIVEEVYRFNDWSEREQKYFERSLGLEEKSIHERSKEELKVLIDRFITSKMVIF